MGFVNSVVLTVVVLLSFQGRPSGLIRSGWEGLMNKEIVKALPNPQTKKIGDVPFSYAVIRDKKAFDALSKVADAKPHAAIHDWDNWAKTINWDREVVVCVVHTESTHMLKLGSLSSSRDRKTKNLGLRFSSIEPSHGNRYPVVLFRFTQKKQDRVAVTIDMGSKKLGRKAKLGTIVLSELKQKS